MLTGARSLWRRARSSGLTRPLLESLDRAWWARTIRRADIVDLEAVAAQLGRPITASAAIRQYVRGGFRRGFSLNPLMMERTVSRQLPDPDRVPALYAYLVNDRARLDVSPHWDAPALAAEYPDALNDPAGPLGFAWRRARREGTIDLGRDGESVRVAWSSVSDALRTRPSSAPTADSAADLFVCVIGTDEIDADEALRLAAATGARLDMHVDIVLRGSPTHETARQAQLLPLYTRNLSVRMEHASADAHPPTALRAGATVFRGAASEISAADLALLARAAAAGPVAALWLAPDGTIASAGRARVGGEDRAILVGHPAEDARRVGAEIAGVALDSPARAWPAGARPYGPGRTLTGITVRAERSVLTLSADVSASPLDMDELLRPAGFALADPTLSGELRRVSPGAGGIRQRWAIKTAAPAGRAGEAWGDTHFARGIAFALERAGAEVVVDAHPAADRSTTLFDDVTLVIRGPRRITPPRHGRRILWIISHPDEITAEELADFDVVFAASTDWARRASERFGVPIHPLLQCTDITRFRPSGAPRTTEIVFVGTARGIPREVVVEPLAAGVPVRVYGPDWRGYIPGSAIAATGIANEDLPALYESASVVLNDHWPAMRREGFISNRLYDVVAAGGRAISDDVAGIADVFGPAVRTYADREHLIQLLTGDLEIAFADTAGIARAADRVRREDSFDARAEHLLRSAR